jgi:hypothetical protein
MPAMPGTLTNWSTAEPYIASAPNWVIDDLNKLRVGAYTFYDSLYLNAPDTWKVLMYATNRKPIYIPSAKVLINTINRYVAPGMDVIVDPAQVAADPTAAAAAPGAEGEAIVDPAQPLRDLFKRTGFYAKFAAEKKMGSARGDWIFMIQGDESKPELARISIVTIDPAAYFPIWDETDPEIRVGCHIVEQWEINGEARIYRTTFRKDTGEVMGGPGTITVEEAIFKTDEWGGPGGMKEGTPVEVVRSPEPLDPRITQIPVYHIRNNYRNGEDFGTSDLSGLESLMMGVNQNASDEDLTLSMTGLGVYTTDAGAPLDPVTGEEADWEIGPAKVVEVPAGHNFGRVSGITTVQPYLDHIAMLDKGIRDTAAISDIALGRVDVSTEPSGIALALELAPTLAMAEEKELEISARLEEMFNDLKAWLLVYEGVNTGETRFIPKYKDKLPPNRKQTFDELMALFTNNIVSAAYVRAELVRLGYSLPADEDMMAQIVSEKQSMQQIVSDVTGSRIDSELNAPPGADDGADT